MADRSLALVVETASLPASTWQQLVLANALRLLAASQTAYVAVLHATWMMLVLLAMTTGAVGDDGVGAAGRAVMRAFRWLGGVDADGRGGIEEVMVVWGKLSVLAWLATLAIAHVRGPRGSRGRWSLLKTSLVSAGIAMAGHGIAMAMLEPGSVGSAMRFASAMAIATLLCTAWAVAVARGVEWLIPRIGKYRSAVMQ